MLPVSGGRDALGITSQASLTALAGWSPGREGARMICDLFSLPLPENIAVCFACWPWPDVLHSQPICLAGPTLPCPCPALPGPRPARRLNPPLTTLSASFPYSLPLATPLAGAKLLLRPHLSYIPRHHSRSSSSHHLVSHAGSHSEQEYSGAQLHVVRSIAALSTPPRQPIFPTPTLDLGAVLARCSRNVFVSVCCTSRRSERLSASPYTSQIRWRGQTRLLAYL